MRGDIWPITPNQAIEAFNNFKMRFMPHFLTYVESITAYAHNIATDLLTTQLKPIAACIHVSDYHFREWWDVDGRLRSRGGMDRTPSPSQGRPALAMRFSDIVAAAKSAAAADPALLSAQPQKQPQPQQLSKTPQSPAANAQGSQQSRPPKLNRNQSLILATSTTPQEEEHNHQEGTRGTSPKCVTPIDEEATSDESPNSPYGNSPSGSRWAKLRTTLKVTGAVTSQAKRRRKQSGLDRQDSFLKRFSTRHAGSANVLEAESDEESEHEKVQREQQQKCKSHFVINPDENFMFYWLAIISIAVLYNLWTCIAREAFPEIYLDVEIVWFVTDGLCDLLYLLDIAVQFRTGYLEKGLIVYSSQKLATHYIHSKYFALDLISLLPLDPVQFLIGIHPLIRFPRFIKVYRTYRFIYMVETRTVYPNMWRVANLSHVLFLGSHWFAAFYFMISKAENYRGTWGYPMPEGEFASVTRKYLKSLYWSTLTLTTIGDLPPPESNWEWVSFFFSQLLFGSVLQFKVLNSFFWLPSFLLQREAWNMQSLKIEVVCNVFRISSSLSTLWHSSWPSHDALQLYRSDGVSPQVSDTICPYCKAGLPHSYRQNCPVNILLTQHESAFV